MKREEKPMPPSIGNQNRAIQHLVTIRPEPPGQFTARAVGLPDVCATAATREEALARLDGMLHAMVSSGTLVALELPIEKPPIVSPGWNPNDPEMLEFLEILEQQSKEDLEQTLRELDQECSNSSSTPIT
jgi:predicted RNase H-like HicB family nuclease